MKRLLLFIVCILLLGPSTGLAASPQLTSPEKIFTYVKVGKTKFKEIAGTPLLKMGEESGDLFGYGKGTCVIYGNVELYSIFCFPLKTKTIVTKELVLEGWVYKTIATKQFNKAFKAAHAKPNPLAG